MSGRGRGGKSTTAPPSVASSISFGAAALSPSALGPPTRFPPNPMPEPVDPSTPADTLALRFQEDFNSFMRTSPYYLTAKVTKETKIDRYSDKYVSHLVDNDRRGKIHAISTDLTFFPEELHAVYNTERAAKMAKSQPTKQTSFLDTLAKLKSLERADELKAESVDGDDDDKEDDDKDGEDEVVFEEEELEDDTDYNLTYFDNGEGDGDCDDGDEGPVY